MKRSSFRIRAAIAMVAMFASVLAFASPAAADVYEVQTDCDYYLETLVPTHVGDDDDNTIVGTQGDDIIFGYGGNDNIRGLGGDDIICGGDGDDRVDGGSGDDELFGGDDVDRVYGRAGDDTMFGNDGDDYMAGANGNDEMHGQAGNDRMFGQNDDDTMFGGLGDDTLNGGRQTDSVDGGTPAPGTTETNRCVDAEHEVNCGEVTTPPQADLSVSLVVEEAPVGEITGLFAAAFTVTNNGPNDATNVAVAFSGTGSGALLLPPACAVLLTFPPTCGDIAAGDSVIVLVGGFADADDSLTMSVSSDTDDPDAENNSATQEFRELTFCELFPFLCT